MLLSRKTVLFASLFCASCSATSERDHEVNELSQAIVYGDDDRLDVYEHPDAMLRELTRSSVVALIRRDIVRQTQAGRVTLAPNTLKDGYELCDGERFENQQIAADCSGVLIDDDLVVTAAHCFDMVPCEDYAVAFDYYYMAPSTLEEMSSADLFYCRRVVARQESFSGDAKVIDFAVIQLDRPVSAPRRPVKIRTAQVEVGEPVVTVGFPSGLPAKIDTGGQVLDARTEQHDFFAFDTDTFRGSSGSGVFDASGNLTGVLVRGGEDYVERAGCSVTNRVEVSDLREWEEATYIEYAIKDVCDEGYPSRALCDIEPTCGDGFCTGGELLGSCAQDCGDKACLAPPCAKTNAYELSLGEPAETDREKSMTDLGPRGCALSPPSQARSALALSLLGLGLLFLRRRRSTRN